MSLRWLVGLKLVIPGFANRAETMIFHRISRQLGSKMLVGHLTAGQTITPIPKERILNHVEAH
jgi:hypothetical protein